jgi:hypothetical protein
MRMFNREFEFSQFKISVTIILNHHRIGTHNIHVFHFHKSKALN